MRQCYYCDRRCDTFEMYKNINDDCPNYFDCGRRVTIEEISELIGRKKQNVLVELNTVPERVISRLRRLGYDIVIKKINKRHRYYLQKKA